MIILFDDYGLDFWFIKVQTLSTLHYDIDLWWWRR